jgi:hypothetical protein
MPRNISFALTTEQVRNRTKTVTRRIGWKSLKAGDVLNACVKCQGLKRGEKPQRICQIRVVSVVQEPLWELVRNAAYGKSEAAKEGFPHMDGAEFVAMFCEHMRPPDGVVTRVTRIEFEYIDEVMVLDV